MNVNGTDRFFAVMNKILLELNRFEVTKILDWVETAY